MYFSSFGRWSDALSPFFARIDLIRTCPCTTWMFLGVLFTYSSFLDSFSFLVFFLYLYLFSMIFIFFHSLFYDVPLPCSSWVRFSYVLLVLSYSFLLWRRMLNFWEKMFDLHWYWSMKRHILRLLYFHALTFIFQNVSSSSSS